MAGCSGAAAPYTSDADTGSTHAIVTIERRDFVAGGDVQARAFASFVRTPPEVDISMVMRATGLDLALPEASECNLGASTARDPSIPPSAMRRVELLSVGRVTLDTPNGRVELAPRAFPAVTDLVAGVVYTTRERVAALPTGEAYAISTAGSGTLPALNFSSEAPAALQGVAIAGVPFGQDSALSALGSEISWLPGTSKDHVYVTLSDGQSTRTCAFRDEAGRGFIPASAIPQAEVVAVGVHRLRSLPLNGNSGMGIDAGELRFDFELLGSVGVVDR